MTASNMLVVALFGSAALVLALLGLATLGPMSATAIVIAWDAARCRSWELSNDRRTAVSPNTGRDSDPIWVCFANASIPAGAKVYYEITVKNAALYTAFGVGLGSTNVYANMGHLTDGSQWQGTVGQPPPNPSHFIVFSYNGGVQEESVYLQQFDQVNRPNPVFWTNPDVIGIAVDTVAKTVQFTLKDSIANSLTNSRTTTHQPGGPWTGPVFPISAVAFPLYPLVTSWKTPQPIATINGGSSPFAMSVPTGFTALDTLLSGPASQHSARTGSDLQGRAP